MAESGSAVRALGDAPLKLIIILGILSATGPLSTDMYLSSLPYIAEEFNVDVSPSQLTLSVFLLGFAIGQLFVGPIADRVGRRPTLIIGFLVYALASIACYVAPTIEALIGLRFTQALGASVGAAITRAIVRDLFRPEQGARVFSNMATIMAVVPAAAPILGGFLNHAFGWRANFAVMTLFGVAASLVVIVSLKESLRTPDPLATRPLRILINFKEMLRHPQFLGCTLAGASAFCGLFAFISGSSFVLQGVFGVPDTKFGFYFAAPVTGYIIGTQMAARLVGRHGHATIMAAGGCVVATAGLLAAALALAQIPHVAAAVAPVALFTVGVGLVLPQAMAGALGPFPDRAGTASSLFGFLQMSLGALVGAAVGFFDDGTQTPMGVIIGMTGLASLSAYWFLARPAFRKSVEIE